MSDTLADLPDDVRELIEPHAVDTDKVLAALSVEIAGKRDEAKAARKASGIEEEWLAAEEAYAGIDDANRHEFTEARWTKSMSLNAPITSDRQPRANDSKSTIFHPLTARYVDAGVAKLCEIVLSPDDRSFSFTETPVPDVIEAKDDDSQVVHPALGPLTRPVAPDDPGPAQQPPAQVAQQPRAPLTVKDLALERIELARKKAKAAETRIYDWMVETNFSAEVRKVIHDAGRLGVGVLKSPVPQVKRATVVRKDNGGISIGIKEKIIPGSVWVDPWNFFPDPTCGENTQNGEFNFERDHMSRRQVRGLKRLPGYIAAQIDKVLKEGPTNSANDNDGFRRDGSAAKDRFEVWYFHGTLTKDEMTAIDMAAQSKTPSAADDVDEVYAIVTMINDTVVKAAINPLSASGGFPYHAMPWRRRAQHWAGVGVAEQMRSAQRITNASLRAMLDNAGVAAGLQIVVKRGGIEPADGNWTISRNKLWAMKEDALGNVGDAFKVYEFPNTTQPLMEIIQLGERFAEDSTSIPLVTQGQSGATTPETYGATQLQNNNANQLLRSLGYMFDDCITEPTVRQHYEYLLLDPDVPDEEKGDWQIDAHGSVALVERSIQDQSLAQMGAMAANPAYGIDPKKWAAEFVRSKHLDPAKLQYTEEEQAKMAAAPQPDPPAVAAAKISADAQIKIAESKLTADQQSVQASERIEQAANILEGNKVHASQQQTHVDATVRLHEIQMRHDLALMDYANQNRISIADAKVQLAKTAMQLQTEQKLNEINNEANDRKHRREVAARYQQKPPVQVPGRAKNGRSFEQNSA